MKNKIIIGSLRVVIAGLTITIALIATKHRNFKENLNPLQSVLITDKEVELKDNTKKYSISITCDDIKDINQQIIYYQLKPVFQDSKVKISTLVLKDKEIITDLSKGLTAINITFDVTTPDNIEQLYYVEATCEK